MKNAFRNSFLFLLIFGLLSVSFVAAEVTQISNTPGMGELPFIKILKDGNIMVIYCEGHHFNQDGVLYYHIYDQSTKTWSGMTQAVKRASSSAYPQLWEDADGNLHMAYHDGNSSSVREIFYAKFNIDSYKWTGRTVAYVSSGVNSTWPRIEGDGDRLFIVWSHNYASTIGNMDLTMIENTIDGTWPVASKSRITISDTSQSVSIHGDTAYLNNKIYVTWMDDNHKPANWNIYYNEGTYNENTESWSFGTSQQLFPSNAAQYYPAIAVDENGVVHLIYSNKNNPVWYTQKAPGGSWTKPKAISTNGADQNMFAVLNYSHGLLHSVIRQGTNVFYVRGLPDGTWSKPTLIHEGQFPGYPGVDVDTAGDVHVVFSDGDPVDHPRNVFYTKVSLPGKPPTAVVTANPTVGLLPLEVTFNGSQSSDTDGKVVDYRWSFGDGSSASGSTLRKTSHVYQEEGTFTAMLTVLDDDMRTGTATVEIEVSSGIPRAVITPSATTGMNPLTVVFDGSDSSDFDGTLVSYVWDLGDGTTSTGETVTNTYPDGGRYLVTLTVTDNDGKSNTAEVEIVVYQKPVATFTTTPSVGKAPLSVDLNASDSYDPDGDIKTYKWDYGDGQVALSKRETHVFSTPGTFEIMLQVVDNDNITDTTTRVIQVLDAPLAPVNITVERMTNRSFMYVDYLNNIAWQENPDNTGLFTIASYRVYRKPSGADDGQYTMVGEVQSGIMTFEDRGFTSSEEAADMVYAVTAVDSDGIESPLSSDGVSMTVLSPRTGSVTRRTKR